MLRGKWRNNNWRWWSFGTVSLYNVSESNCDDNQIRFKRYILQENINFESQEDRNEVENSELNLNLSIY